MNYQNIVSKHWRLRKCCPKWIWEEKNKITWPLRQILLRKALYNYFHCCIHQNYQAFSKELAKLDLTALLFRARLTYSFKKWMNNENHDCGQILPNCFSYSLLHLTAQPPESGWKDQIPRELHRKSHHREKRTSSWADVITQMPLQLSSNWGCHDLAEQKQILLMKFSSLLNERISVM